MAELGIPAETCTHCGERLKIFVDPEGALQAHCPQCSDIETDGHVEMKMKAFSISLDKSTVYKIDWILSNLHLHPSRSELFRVAIRDHIIKLVKHKPGLIKSFAKERDIDPIVVDQKLDLAPARFNLTGGTD